MLAKDLAHKYLNRFSLRILDGYSAYALWRSIKMSLNNNVLGNIANENAIEMNIYNNMFPIIIFSLETTFIIELYKFFDKRKDTLKLIERTSLSAGIAKSNVSLEDKEKIKNLISENEDTIIQIEKLRHQLFAHDKTEREPNLKIPSIDSLDKLFKAIKEIHNIISKGTTGDFYVWPDNEGKAINRNFVDMLDKLKKERKQQIKEDEEEWKRKYGQDESNN